MLHTMIPWREDTNLGQAYNEEMDRLPEGGWAVLLDHDVMFTTFEWNRQIQAAIAAEPEGTFTGVTNRIGCPWQRIGIDMNNHDIRFHRMVGHERLSNRWLSDVTDSIGWGGYIMAISNEAWKAFGGFRDGQLCVDHMMHFDIRRQGRRAYLIEGLYMYHYRQGSGEHYQGKTQRVNQCDCLTRKDWAAPKRVKEIEFTMADATIAFDEKFKQMRAAMPPAPAPTKNLRRVR
jgi:hypothetical protein